MRMLTGAAILWLALATTAWAQATVHQHYAKDAHSDQPAADGRMAPRLQSLGSHKFPVTTKSAEAQKFIDQGMNLSYGFNHAEAGRAFADFGHVAKALEDRKITPLSSELEYIPQTPTHLPDDQANAVLKLVDSLEQDEDVQKVFHNLG